MKHDPIPTPYPDDDMGIGQAAMALIRMKNCQKEMREYAEPAFANRYVSPPWRSMCRRHYRKMQREYAHARAVYETHTHGGKR